MPLPAVLRRYLPQTVLSMFGYPRLTLKSIVAYGDSNFTTYNLLPRPDEALKHFAPVEGIKYYRRVRRQLGSVSGIVKLRLDAVMALPHTWVPGDVNDPESVDWCEGVKQVWKNVQGLMIAMRKMMFCVPDGLSIAEVIYGTMEVAFTVKANRENPNPANVGRVQKTETWVVPIKIIDLPLEKFAFDRDLNLRFRANDGEKLGELVDPMQVLIGRFGSNQPYGEGEMIDITTDAWKLDWLDREGLKALEKSGYPLAQVTVPEHWDEDRIKSTLAFAEYTYKNFMIVRMGDRFEITFPDESVRPTFIGAEQVTRIKQIQDDISIGYLGVSFSNSTTGAKARDQVRNEMRFEKTSSDSAVFDDIANQFEEKVRLLNRPSMPAYKRAWMQTDYKPTVDVAQRSNLFVQAAGIGYPVSIQQMSEEMQLRPAMWDEDRLTSPEADVENETDETTPGMNRMSDPAQNDGPFSSVRPKAVS